MPVTRKRLSSITGTRILQQLDGARIIRVDPRNGMFIVWYGGTTIRVIDTWGKEKAIWSVAPPSSRDDNNLSWTDIIAANMDHHIRTGDYMELVED